MRATCRSPLKLSAEKTLIGLLQERPDLRSDAQSDLQLDSQPDSQLDSQPDRE
ncbi:hypothetical protein BABINDRAFT_160680 [Babjeviella inositovora NRRL Y-12698]|uniref:Uncharacterized protein n=1 Tax=Babjeviella inositovora NRRL Y-12698 TaxID=984486 RepID=A0A1E3QUF6_9ASCO|nr:uncharacterized protein BABINDRAFT_160680 [Babjeviella inositovora NRRL Y-12698]ODQ81319.1 hypothetical protein BABINDRAFT_160680 [Babjeviella inositovora NRRL Y-12698]